ncbi:uncharacterized protein [Spinacia oleracea]|uniref:CCHC-type domain-containing protein n=1 Tax=Spinacia oleracea TaxID=3562 RepID=A0A9R0JAQ8_SPIOL|nr:uncharacterized protein LOC110778918 [Spinacia oleracea]
MRKIWNPKHGMDAKCLEKNMFFFQFHHWRDKEFAMEAQPWHFDKHILALCDVKGDLKPSEYPLHLVPFWVRVYDLPIMGRNNEANAKIIGNKLGEFMKVDQSDIVGINKSLRIRVMIDVQKPLKDEIEIKMRGAIVEKVEVWYKKLPIFCYVCGKLGHGEKDCESISSPTTRDYKFSEKLRASPWIVNKGDGKEYRREGKTCARNLFVIKKKNDPPNTAVELEKRVDLVVEKFGSVKLDAEKAHEKVNEENCDSRVEGIGSDALQETTRNNVVVQAGNMLSFNIGSNSNCGRKFRRVKRAAVKETGPNDTRQEGEKGGSGGKRKHFMEIDEFNAQKTSRVEDKEEDDSINHSVAVAAVQSREQQ